MRWVPVWKMPTLGDRARPRTASRTRCRKPSGAPIVSGEDGLRALDLALRIEESMPEIEDLD